MSNDDVPDVGTRADNVHEMTEPDDGHELNDPVRPIETRLSDWWNRQSDLGQRAMVLGLIYCLYLFVLWRISARNQRRPAPLDSFTRQRLDRVEWWIAERERERHGSPAYPFGVPGW